jgi:aminocarboxymuconate-semialdehyde decarboxylase
VPLDVAVKATRMVNDGIAAFCAKHADRLRGFGSVPMMDGGEAVRELERCVNELGFAGVQILTNVAGKELSDAAFAPFWKRAEELGAVVLLHPNGFTEASRLSRFYFNNVIGNPLETTIALHYLIFDGVLERHPKLKLIAAHGGGYLGSYPGRIDHAWGARSDCHGSLPQPPSTYLKRVYVDSVVFTPHQLAELVRVSAPITF